MTRQQRGTRMLAVAVLSLCAAVVSASSASVTDVDDIFKNLPTGAVGLSGASRPVGRTLSDHPSQEYKPACLQTVTECQGQWEDVSCCDSKAGHMHMADISPLSPRPQGRCYLNTGGLGGLSNMALQKMVATLDPQAKFAGYGGITCQMNDGADECSSPLCDGMVLQTKGPLWVRLVASKTRPVPLPPTSDCSAPGFLSSNAGGDEDKLWIGPVIVSSLPMDVSSRDKLNKYEKGWFDRMVPQTIVCLKEGYDSISCTSDPTSGLQICACTSSNRTLPSDEPGWIQVPAAAVREAGVPVVDAFSNKLRFFKPDSAY